MWVVEVVGWVLVEVRLIAMMLESLFQLQSWWFVVLVQKQWWLFVVGVVWALPRVWLPSRKVGLRL